MSREPLGPIPRMVAVSILVAAGIAAGYWWGHRKPLTPAAATESRATERKVLYWHDPMVPGRKFDKPGKSPFMDMALVPVYADEAGNASDVHVSATAARDLGIRLGKVEKVALHASLRAVGNVAFDEDKLELVQARVEGYVTRLHVKAPLERVRRGQPLADILAPQWVEAEQEYLALLDARSPSAQAIRDAARQRLHVLGVPEATIRTIEAKRETQAGLTLVAPIDGAVTELGAREGMTIMAGATLFRINGLGTVWVNAQIPEARISMVPVGAAVVAHATAWPGVVFEGHVIALLPDVNRETRTLTARVAFDNRDGKLAPGMFVSLDVTTRESEPQLVVPSEAVITTGERSVIVVADERGGYKVIDVTVGAEQEGRSVILSGVSEGQSVVVSGQFLIDSEASLKSTTNRLEAERKP